MHEVAFLEEELMRPFTLATRTEPQAQIISVRPLPSQLHIMEGDIVDMFWGFWDFGNFFSSSNASFLFLIPKVEEMVNLFLEFCGMHLQANQQRLV